MVHNICSHKFFITFNERTIERSKRTIIFMCFFFTVNKKRQLLKRIGRVANSQYSKDVCLITHFDFLGQAGMAAGLKI